MNKTPRSFLVGFGWCALIPAFLTTAAAGEQNTATRPSTAASRPASEIVLARVGDTTVTQEDFNYVAGSLPPQRARAMKANILTGLIRQKLLSLHLDEHPEIVDDALLQKKVMEIARREGVDSRRELEEKLRARGDLDRFERYVEQSRLMLGRVELLRRAEEKSKDEAYLRELWDRDPSAFDGSRRRVRQILIAALPWETPEQLQAKREKAERIREDIVSGRRTWESCVQESDGPRKVVGGELGLVPRHLERPEAVAEEAFALKEGQTSEVIETPAGFYIIQVTGTHQGDLNFDQAKPWIKLFAQRYPLMKLEDDTRAEYKVVGVREPDLPPPPASRPAADLSQAPKRTASRPGTLQRRPPTRRPGTSTTTRPRGPVRTGWPSTRPAALPRPAAPRPTQR